MTSWPEAPVVVPGGDLTLDPRLAVRAATVALAVTAALWHAVNVATLPSAAPWPLAAGLVLAVATIAWTAWLVRSPSRSCLRAGAVGGSAILAGSLTVLVVTPGPRLDVAVLTGLSLQAMLLLSIGVSCVPVTGPRLLRATTRTGLACVAVTMSVLVAGGTHAHGQGRGTTGNDAPPSATALLCHLI